MSLAFSGASKGQSAMNANGKPLTTKTKVYENKGDLQTPYNGPKVNPHLVDGKYKDLNTSYTLKGEYTYVIDQNGNLQMAETSKLGLGGGHTSLTKGAPVKYAGTMHFTKSGQLTEWTNGSGHYAPLASGAADAANWLEAAGLLDATIEKFIGVGR